MGLLTGAPIAALYAALWTPAARRAFPALEDMHKAECDPLDALFEGMTPAQVRFLHFQCYPCLRCFSSCHTHYSWALNRRQGAFSCICVSS